MSGRHSWDEYVEEAAHEPFVLDYREDGEIRSITINQPTSIQMMRVAQGLRSGDPEAIMIGLCGDAWEQIYDLLAKPGVGMQAMLRLEKDLLAWFDLNDEVEMVGPGGGKRRVKDPEEIARLVRMGWSATGN